MKNFLMSLIGISTISATTSGLATNQTTIKINDYQSNLVKVNQNINKIIWQSEGNYSYNYQLYVSHDVLKNWNSLYNHKLSFEFKVAYNLKTFESNTIIKPLGTYIVASSLYEIWVKDKVMSYEHKQGIIFKLEYSRYSLQSATITSQ